MTELLRNFGRNLAFRPAQISSPRSAAEVLQMLDEVRGRGGEGDCYALSFSGYARLAERAGFLRFARCLARVLHCAAALGPSGASTSRSTVQR